MTDVHTRCAPARPLSGAAGVLTIALLAAPALAAPPPEGSEDWQIMHPYAEWVRTQRDRQGFWCCDIGDGRPVEARIRGDHWEAHVTPKHFPEEQDHWVVVPESKITPDRNPTGVPILWLLHGRVQCFAPPDGA